MHIHRLLKTISIILGVIVTLVFVAQYFVYKDIKKRNENYHVLLSDLSFQNNKQGYLNIAQKIVDENSSDIALVDKSIIPIGGEVDFLGNLESVAKENGLVIEISSLAFEKGETSLPGPIGVLKIRAKTKGTWAGNYKFLSRLEALPVKVKINKFSLVNTSSDGESLIDDAKYRREWQGLLEFDVLKYK